MGRTHTKALQPQGLIATVGLMLVNRTLLQLLQTFESIFQMYLGCRYARTFTLGDVLPQTALSNVGFNEGVVCSVCQSCFCYP